jgi:hypothetical protein
MNEEAETTVNGMTPDEYLRYLKNFYAVGKQLGMTIEQPDKRPK